MPPSEKSRLRVVVLCGVAALVLLVVFAGTIGRHWSDDAKSRLIELDGPLGELVLSKESPSGQWLARMYVREEGGPTSDTWIAVEVIDATSGTARAVYSAPNGSPVMEWIGPDELEVDGERIEVRSETYLRFW
jgi:hypothetical protein